MITCPNGCGCGLYGDNPDAPLMWDCGSGYMTEAQRPEDFSESMACGIIKALRGSKLPPSGHCDKCGINCLDCTYHDLIAERDELLTIVSLYDDCNLHHDCDLEGWDMDCSECRAARAMYLYQTKGLG